MNQSISAVGIHLQDPTEWPGITGLVVVKDQDDGQWFGGQNLLCCLPLFSSVQSLRSLGKTRLQTDGLSSGILLADCRDFCLATTGNSEPRSHLAGRVPGGTLLPHHTLGLFDPL